MTPLAPGAGGTIVWYATKSLVVKEPVGVVAVTCGINSVLPCVAQEAAPALVAGRMVVVKVPKRDLLAIFAMAEHVTAAGFPLGSPRLSPPSRSAIHASRTR